MTTPALMAYVAGADGIDSRAGAVALYYEANNQLFTMNAVSVSGFRQFVGYPSGDETLSATAAALGLAVVNGGGTDSAAAVTAGGICLFVSDTGNYCQVAAVNGVTCTLVAKFGIPGGFGPSGPTKIATPGSVGTLRTGSNDYFVTGSLYSIAPGQVCYLPADLSSNTVVGTITEENALIGGGPAGSVFILGRPKPTLLPTTTGIGLYTFSISGGLIHLGSITPAQIDATWTHISDATGVAYDQTDGNAIITVSTGDAVSNQHYIVKLSKTNASVLWTVAVNAGPAYDSGIGRSIIKNSTFYYLGGSETLYTVDTSAGTATTASVTNAVVSGPQISEDVAGSLIFRGNWTESGTPPTYIGTYMGTDGNHGVTSQWMRYFPVYPPPTPPTPPAPKPAPYLNINRAWTFTLDGHTFYVLDLGPEGTFAYDLTTKQWCEFQTAQAAQTNWNMVNGVMWGQRIIAGDISTTDVWELVPSATKDNGAQAIDITHVCTGGLTVRTRQYRSCASLSITASFGQLDDAAGATFTMSYSDDFGQTWAAPAAITLAEGDYDSEIVWRSLGSFARPGRIFQLSDSGGLIRIDGCDAAIDDFDDDKPQEQT